MKIADFGLTRDIYDKDYYRMSDRTKPVPAKWMALESLVEGHYSTKSDVVSVHPCTGTAAIGNLIICLCCEGIWVRTHRTRYPSATRKNEVETIVLLVTVHTERDQKSPRFLQRKVFINLGHAIFGNFTQH